MFVGLFCRQLANSSYPLIVVENEVLPDSFAPQADPEACKTKGEPFSAVCLQRGLKCAMIRDRATDPAPAAGQDCELQYFYPRRKPAFVSTFLRILACVAALAVVEAEAADQGVVVQHGNLTVPVESPPGGAFLERFTVEFDRRIDEQFADRFHPFTVMNWSIDLANNSSDHFREHAASAARNALSKSLVYSVREAAVDLPILAWLKERQGVLADFLRNSVDSVGEEAVAPLELSYRLVERSWWQRLSQSGHLQYGVRPFRTSPYAFLSTGIRDNDRLFLLGHVRYHYRNFAEHRFEVALSLPLDHGFAIDVGTSYQFGGHDEEEERLVVKLFKEFKRGGILHVGLGLEARQRPAFLAGIALPW